ncbi:SDR family NAD(P)-dependent oxidoreductase [Frigoribacterium sp. PhB24]|uniref:SDR family NAD(P)-dependent oxidoreductase n=1 Tax=Frigoribacterium sp. PhB24 TaxID=2485204 RepID=UPI000F48D414|nr:SDR family oxidoreductase [Frigoribacterium sp. PhB24]ROS50315.1 short-subunit dehydrogenase [Frigoribacterium sp. PhB24]
MDLRLDGTTALVTGSTQGIGRAVASVLAAEGAHVIVNGRDEARVAAAVDRLRADHPGGAVEGFAADLAEPAELARLFDALDDRGGVDVLVNNVGLFGLDTFGSATDDDWARYLEVNLMSGVRLSRHLLGGMLDRGRGRIVFVGSESGVDVPADMIPYGVTKAATIALANGLAKLTRGTGVTVNTVLGGPTWSDGVAAAAAGVATAQGVPVEQLKEALVARRGTSLLQRFIDPDEIASLVAYLVSPRASATNGAALRADGGVLTGML